MDNSNPQSMLQTKENQTNNARVRKGNSTKVAATKRSFSTFQHSTNTTTATATTTTLEPPNKVIKQAIDSPTSVTSPSSIAKPEYLPTVVTLPREVLLVSSRQDLDEFVKRQTGGRKLTREEKAEVSRQRKLIKNRKSASASRKRKKEHLEILEESHKQLMQENALLKERIQKLEAESSKMSNQVSFVNKLTSQFPFFAQAQDLFKNAKKASLSIGMQQAIALLLIFQISLSVNFFIASQSTEFNQYSSKHLGFLSDYYYNNNNNNQYHDLSNMNKLNTREDAVKKSNDFLLDKQTNMLDKQLLENFYSSSPSSSSASSSSSLSSSFSDDVKTSCKSGILEDFPMPLYRKKHEELEDFPGSSSFCNGTALPSDKYISFLNDNSDSSLSNSDENNANSSTFDITTDNDTNIFNNTITGLEINNELTINSTNIELDIFSEFFNPSTTTINSDIFDDIFNNIDNDSYDVSYVVPQ